MWRPRLLPLTILALAVLLGQKCTLLATAALADFPASAAAAETVAPAVPPVVNWDSTQPPPAVCPPETTINPSEIAVLSALRQRAASLDARDAALDRKQALIDAAEKSLTGQLAGLQAVEDHLNALSQNQSAADEARWQALVATYEAMDPQAATRMNSRKSAPILADMSPDKARQATELMAGQGQDITLGTPLPPATGQ
jgi:flagellar motility protein MotE (MotC chaperone)